MITEIIKQVNFKSDTIKMSVEINYKEGRLSITGTTQEYDKRWRDVGGGQNYDDLVQFFGNDPKALRLFEIWTRWHLNDMNAGDELQERYIRNLKLTGWKYDYQDACDKLAELGIYIHDGYKYGTAWKFETVPQKILQELEAL